MYFISPSQTEALCSVIVSLSWGGGGGSVMVKVEFTLPLEVQPYDRASVVDALCRDGTSQISLDLHTKTPLTR